MRELIERYLTSVYPQLKPFQVPSEVAYLFAVQRPPYRRAKADEARSTASLEKRQDLYQQVQVLRQQDLSIRKIARQLQLHRATVRKYYVAETVPAPQKLQHRCSMLEPYIPYLTRRQQEGCENTMMLWREIVSLGYPGSHRQVQRWLQQRRFQPSPNTPKAYIREQEISPPP